MTVSSLLEQPCDDLVVSTRLLQVVSSLYQGQLLHSPPPPRGTSTKARASYRKREVRERFPMRGVEGF